MTDPIDASVLLSRLQGMAREAGLPSAAPRPGDVPGMRGIAEPRPIGATRPAAAEAPHGVDFGALVGDAVRAVDARADAARELTVGYERGRPDVELADVMIAAQKARVSFEALLQVRNKMVSAYRDVMNMPL